MTILDAFNNFKTIINNANNNIAAICDPLFSSHLSMPQIKEVLICSAFINVYSNWEKYLEDTVIEYALGGKNLNNWQVTKFITPSDEEHAIKIINGEVKYMDWSSPDIFLPILENIFKDGEPYKTTISGILTALRSIKKIRNHIAHNSIKSKNDFDNLVRNELSPAHVGESVSTILTLSKNRKHPPLYLKYFALLETAADNIANYLAE